MKLKNDASTQLASYQYGGRSYTLSQVKADLANRFERFKTADATLASLKDIQTARKKSLDAARAALGHRTLSQTAKYAEMEEIDAELALQVAAEVG